jgi:hypothetical protein
LVYILTAIISYETVNTAYTVGMIATCGPGLSGKQSVMHAPNSDQSKPIAKQFYCVEGPCVAVGTAYWDANGPAGGPEVLAPAIELANAYNNAGHVPNLFVSELYNS